MAWLLVSTSSIGHLQANYTRTRMKEVLLVPCLLFTFMFFYNCPDDYLHSRSKSVAIK